MPDLIAQLNDPNFFWMLAVILFALFVRGAFGFGDGLIAVPLLAWSIPVKEAVPLIMLLSIVTSMFGVVRERSSIQLGSLKRAGIFALLSFPIGIVALRWFDERLVTVALGCVLVLLSIWYLTAVKPPRLTASYWSYIFGFAAGVLGGAYALRGIVFAVYGSLRGWTPAELRATLHGFYLVSSVLVPGGYWAAGLLTPSVLVYVLLLSVPAIFAGWVGYRVSRSVEASSFKRGLWWLVGASGVWLAIRGFI